MQIVQDAMMHFIYDQWQYDARCNNYKCLMLHMIYDAYDAYDTYDAFVALCMIFLGQSIHNAYDIWWIWCLMHIWIDENSCIIDCQWCIWRIISVSMTHIIQGAYNLIATIFSLRVEASSNRLVGWLVCRSSTQN